MVDFEIGKTYTSRKGMPFTVTAITDDLLTIQCRLLKKKARRTLYCGVQAAVFNLGDDMILAEKIVPNEDPSVEYGYNQRQVTVNTHGESYVNLFKRHKEENAAH